MVAGSSRHNNDPLDEIDNSNNYEVSCIGGESARKYAEEAVHEYKRQIVIAEPFRLLT